MEQIISVEFDEIEENQLYIDVANKVFQKCFEIENLLDKNLYINIVFTSPNKIHEINKKYRDVDRETDVLSFPMYEKEELENYVAKPWKDILGDIIISIEQVKKQAEEYGHSFERELAYMMVHGFYHLMGEDHIEENDKRIMREKEENVLNELNITRIN